MAPRSPNDQRNKREERDDLDAYEQPMSEKANILTELAVNMQYVQRDISEIKKKIDTLQGEFVTQKEFSSLDKRVAEIEDARKWVVTLVFGSIILAVLGLILKVKGGF